jgi:hypothetical protein
MPSRATRLLLPLLLSACLASTGSPARAETDATAQKLATLAQRYKAIAIQQLREGAERRHELAERARSARLAARARRAGKAVRGERIRPSRDEAQPLARPLTRAEQRARQERIGSLATNVRVNNPFTDGPHAGQAEVSLATYGANVLVAWNDGDGFNQSPFGSTQGYGYSTNDGQSFTDGGIPPAIPGGWTWDSDPVVMVNESNGDFWYCGLISTSGQNGIGAVRGRFSGSSFSWDPPHIARAYSNFEVLLDKPWMAVDPSSGRVYMTFTAFSFDGQTDTIDVQSTMDGVNWSAPLALSSPSDAGYVQGSRVVVGPNGEVHTTWYAIGQYPGINDYFRYRRSTNGGASFNGETTPVSLFSNYGSGAPGFNRPRGITFPSLAVDRTSGPHRGRAYLSWNESVNYFDDNIGYLNRVDDPNSNTTPATATQFVLGDSIVGAFSSAGLLHYFKFTAIAGQTAVFFANQVNSLLDMSMRVLCTDGTTRLAYSEPGMGANNLIVFSFPTTGTYYLRLASAAGSGPYTIWTGPSTPSPGERARDHRDVFVTGSDNGVLWSTPVRASDSAVGLDDWLPELGVSADSKVYVAWYDWRDAAAVDCAGNSQLYMATSSDGGGSFSTLGALSDASSNWTTSFSNIAPNQGDYIGFFAGCEAVYASWGDARDTTVDVYLARYPPGAAQGRVTFSSVQTTTGSATLAWQAAVSETALAVLYRRVPSGSFSAIDSGRVDGAGRYVFADTTVASGTRYDYRLGLQLSSGELLTCITAVDIPAIVIKLAIEPIAPNPTKGPMVVAFTPGTSASARVDLVDIAGRKIQTVETGTLVAGQRSFVSLGIGITIKPGLYFVRISQSGKDASKRVAVVQ